MPPQLCPQPFLIPIFNFSHKWPTFAFTDENGYTHSALGERSHTRAHTAKQGCFGWGVVSLPSERPARSQTSPGRVTERQTLPLWGLGRGHSRRTQRAFGAAMRLCASLFRRRRGPAGLRNTLFNLPMLHFLRSAHGISACARWRRYHYPRCTPRIVETPGAHLSKRLICYSLDLTDYSLIPAVQNIISFSLQIPEEPARHPLVLPLLSVFPLLALIGPIQESNDLREGVTVVGAARGCRRTVGHAAFHCSSRHIGVIGVSGNVRKGRVNLSLNELCGGSHLRIGHGESVLAITLVGCHGVALPLELEPLDAPEGLLFCFETSSVKVKS